MKLVALHIHPYSAKAHALHAQSKSLFSGIFSAQLDCPARANYAMPGQSGNLPQDTHHLPSGSGPARSFSDRSVTRHRSCGQGANATDHAGALVFIFILILIMIMLIPIPTLWTLPLGRAFRGLGSTRPSPSSGLGLPI